jgi:hypothetical protein
MLAAHSATPAHGETPRILRLLAIFTKMQVEAPLSGQGRHQRP